MPEVKKTLEEIARLVGGEVVGDPGIVITGVSGIKEAQDGDITFLANPKYAPLLEKTHASAIITSREITKAAKPIIRTDNPSLAFTKIVSFVLPVTIKHPVGVHSTAVIGKDVKLGRGVAIGPYAVIADNASLGDNTVVYSGSYIGCDTVIGNDVIIYPNVSVRERISIDRKSVV
jgi:UDP-3-O-[3-hydroxymyristoyl] glucosamine N-acyltransferase